MRGFHSCPPVVPPVLRRSLTTPATIALTSRAHVHLLVNGRMLVLGELPDPWTLAGTALIVLAGLYVLRRVR